MCVPLITYSFLLVVLVVIAGEITGSLALANSFAENSS